MLEILIAISCLGQFTTGDIPASLVKAFQQREDFRSSRLRYEVEREFPGYQARKMSRYEVLTAANDIAWTNFGDADGIVERDIPTGMPRFGLAFACAPYQIIRGHSTGVEWNQTKGYSVISRSKPNRFLSEEIDPRNIGLYPLSQRDRLPSELLHQLFETPGQWSEAAAGDLIEVRMMCQPNSDEDPTYGVLIWKIDPTKDFTLIECRKEIVESDGNRYVSASCHTEYQQFDGRWWPKRYRARAERTGYDETLEFHVVEFDRPSHPSELTPEIWNLPVGVLTSSRFDPETGDTTREDLRYMGGDLLVSEEVWEASHTDGDIAALKAFWKHNRAIGWGKYPRWWNSGDPTLGLPSVAFEPDEWEAYVRRWILRHSVLEHDRTFGDHAGLNPKQVAAAWAILEDCRREAAPIVKRRDEDEARALALSAKNVTRVDGAIEETTTAEEPPPMLARPVDEFNSPAHPEPRWETPEQVQITQRKSNRAFRRLTARKSSRHDRELAHIFESLKKRLTGLLETRQMLPDEVELRAARATTGK